MEKLKKPDLTKNGTVRLRAKKITMSEKMGLFRQYLQDEQTDGNIVGTTVYKGFPIGRYLIEARYEIKKGGETGKYTKEIIDELEQMGLLEERREVNFDEKVDRLIDFVRKYPKLWSSHIVNYKNSKEIGKRVNEFLYEQDKIDEPKTELMAKLIKAEKDYEYLANRTYRGLVGEKYLQKLRDGKVGRRFGYRREIEVLASGHKNESKFAEFLYTYDKNNGGLDGLKKSFVQEVRDTGEIKDTPYIENLESIHFDISSASLHNEGYDRLYDAILELVNFKRNFYISNFGLNGKKTENPERQFRIIDSNAMKQIIEKKLKPNERTVLQLRFGLDENERTTLENVGNKLGVKRERARQIEVEAIRKMERYFGEYLIALSPEDRAKFVETYFSKHRHI